MLRCFTIFGLLVTACGTTMAADYSAVINLNGKANRAVLEDDANTTDNIYQVRSTNGSFATISFEMPTDVLTINMLGGNDRLTVRGSTLPTLTAILVINGGRGSDSIRISGLDSFSSVISDDSVGNNSILMQDSKLVGDLSVFDGPGKQTVNLRGGAVVEGNVLVQSTDGASCVRVGSNGIGTASVLGSVLIDNAGFGDDIVELAGFVQGDFFANTGNGVTNFQSFFSLMGGSLSVLVDGGELKATIAEISIGGSLFAHCNQGATVKSIFNSNIDGLINFHSGLGFDEATLLNVRTPEVRIENGEGGSILNVRDGFTGPPFRLDIGVLTVISGQGGDEVDIASLGNTQGMDGSIGTLDINSGDGNSRLEIGAGFTLGNVVHSSGGGFDIVTLTGTTIANNFISFNFGGGSDVIFTDAFIGGAVDVQSLDGTDIFRIFNSEFGGNVNMSTGNGTDTFTLVDSVFFGDFVADGGFDFDIFETTNDSVFNGIDFINEWEWILDF